MDFKLTSEYFPTGDQPEAIAELVDGVNNGVPHQTLLGVTGSGKTFTMANVIQKVKRPTLILSHNKTLAAQLAAEFRELLPNNAVVEAVADFLSVSDRYSDFTLGIISYDNVIFFLTMQALFLFLTVRVLDSKRWS